MRIPLDRVCVKSGLLCSSCQAKIDSGQYERWEVDVMRVLLDLEDRFRELRAASYRKSVKVGNVIYVVLDGVSSLSRDLGRELQVRLSGLGVREVQVITGASDPRSLLNSLLGGPVTSLNTYYVPDGSVYYVARVPSDVRERLSGSEEGIRRSFKAVVGADLYIEYEEEGRRGQRPVSTRLDKERIEDWLKRLGR